MISQTSEYALRASVYLAARPPEQPASAHEIAGATQVPVGYLQKVLRVMVRRGILTAHRGTGGGFALAKPASAISVLDVLRAAGASVQRIEKCPLGIEGHATLCPLHGMLDEQMARTERIFATTSLADLVISKGNVHTFCDQDDRPPTAVSVQITAPKPPKGNSHS
ncbi:MAG: Rrf2 family transcriptional regulator [Planctomycetota bacterium]|nr:MAG: Rrf2 family transcriptional regulator [Planctomycetota bacterium]